jgi:hypothetical protein
VASVPHLSYRPPPLTPITVRNSKEENPPLLQSIIQIEYSWIQITKIQITKHGVEDEVEHLELRHVLHETLQTQNVFEEIL